MLKSKDKLPEFEPPKKRLQLEYEQQVKTLLKTQSNITTSLQIELQKQKGFQKRTEFPTFVNIAGKLSLKELQSNEEKQCEIEKLLDYGLETADIELYQQFIEYGLEFVQQKHSNHEPNLLKAKIDSLIKIIEEEKNNALISTSKSHPMNNIKILESNLQKSMHFLSKEYTPDIRKIRQKARKAANRLQRLNTSKTNNANLSTTVSNSKTNWDITEITKDDNAPVIYKQKVKHTCAKQNFYTINNGEIVKLNQHKREEHVFNISGQLSMEEIKQMPQFANYNTGNPSNVIYVKNLPRQTTIADLKHYFKDFPADEYKMMSGKMRGQAFLTFNSVESATKMLTALNGLVISTKPIILQFGRKQAC